MKNSLLLILVLLLALPCAGQSNRFLIDDFEIEPDSVVTMPVVLANESPTRGFQFNMTMPSGLYIEDFAVTSYSRQYKMNMSCRLMDNEKDYVIFVYPSNRICYPPDSVAVITLTFYAEANFKGGEIVITNCVGSTLENETFPMQGDTAIVTVATSSLVGILANQQPVNDKYFNLQGLPISSPGDAPVAIRVTTGANGQVESCKMSHRH